MAEQDEDRSEDATPHKLEEARKKGQVAKSQDFTATAILAAMVAVIYGNGWDAIRHTLQIQQSILQNAPRLNWSADALATWLGHLLLGMLVVLGPLFLALVIVAVLASLFQTGPIFSFHPLSPDMDKINPANGIKRLFSMRTVFDAAKSLIKLVLLGTVIYFMLADNMGSMMGLSMLEPKSYTQASVNLLASLLVKLVLLLIAIALLDLSYTRYEFAKRMRMSTRDIKDEVKNREGDPRIRARIRDLRNEMRKRSKSLAKLPSADVLIVNPTHLAVALTYQHGQSTAPKVVAKGAGDLAHKMRQIAAKHGIPVVQNKALARTLFKEVDYDGFVPEKIFPQIAKIMVWAYTMRNQKRPH